MLVPTLVLLCGLALIAFAVLAPAASIQAGTSRRAARERIRMLEALAHVPGRIDELRKGLADPDLEVAAIAAVLLQGAGRSDLVRASPRVDELLKRVPAWRR